MIVSLADADATRALGARIAQALKAQRDAPALIALSGELGAGKTTLAAGLLGALGHRGPTRSPTYTLVEPYELDGRTLLHADLYRLETPDDLNDLGLRDALTGANVVLIEWPERAAGRLGVADVFVRLVYANHGRDALLEAGTVHGARLVESLG